MDTLQRSKAAEEQRKTIIDKPVLVIKATHGWAPLKLKELWEVRELIWFLAWRDISARYKQTAAGLAWAILQPLMAMVIFTVVFGKLAKIPADGVHYPVFCYAAMLPWQYFSSATINASSSLIRNVHLLTKVHFPRLAIPVSGMIPPMFDFAAGCLVLIPLMIHFDVVPTWRIFVLPVFLLLAIVTALGAGLWFSALSIEYRDFHHILPFLIQLGMFASPVVYSSSLVPQYLRPLFGLNPMAGVIAGIRWCLFGTPIAPGPPMILLSSLVSITVLVSGAYYFRRMERTFADIV